MIRSHPKTLLALQTDIQATRCVGPHAYIPGHGCFGLLAGRHKISFSPSKQVSG